MLTKTITYKDFNGVEQTDEFLFNLTEAELTEMELSINGGLAEKINRIVKAKDAPSIVEIFKDLILRSYGEKSIDGKRFIKTKELKESFAQTQAYSDLFMELSTDDKAAAAFINGIVPANKKQTQNSLNDHLSKNK